MGVELVTFPKKADTTSPSLRCWGLNSFPDEQNSKEPRNPSGWSEDSVENYKKVPTRRVVHPSLLRNC